MWLLSHWLVAGVPLPCEALESVYAWKGRLLSPPLSSFLVQPMNRKREGERAQSDLARRGGGGGAVLSVVRALPHPSKVCCAKARPFPLQQRSGKVRRRGRGGGGGGVLSFCSPPSPAPLRVLNEKGLLTERAKETTGGGGGAVKEGCLAPL